LTAGEPVPSRLYAPTPPRSIVRTAVLLLHLDLLVLLCLEAEEKVWVDLRGRLRWRREIRNLRMQAVRCRFFGRGRENRLCVFTVRVT
jgi:hypothetical protein